MVEIFPKAPITEALIDIRVQLPDTVTLENLEAPHSLIQSDYPKKKTRRKWQGEVQFKEDSAPVATSKDLGIDGYFFTSEDDKQVVQFRLDGFTFSRLRPYQQWSHLRDEAKRLWEVYTVQVSPITVDRLAVRYINSIEIPSKRFDLEVYFTSPPDIPKGLPCLIEHFFTRVLIQFPEKGAKAFVTQTISKSSDPLITPIILDIDAFVEATFKPDSESIWSTFETLRDLKDQVFFSSVTEKSKELFR
jgi:uncharacterized protein (TIGR04255 family)